MMMRTALAALATMLALGSNVRADDFPSHPITMVVPFSAGGPTDAMARILAERMRTKLGQSFVIENVTGAGGSLGVGRVVRSSPDGYTVSIGHLGTHVANGAVYKLGYDLVADLEPVVLLPSNPMVIVSKNAIPANTLPELLAWLKAKPTPPIVGTAGAGSGSHIAGLYFEKNYRHQAGIRAVSWHGTGVDGSRCRSDRHHDRSNLQFHQPDSRRYDPGLCRD